jgi:3-hydroxyacyl-CoA dehydrogenase/3-hydroxy-2-methylbutyryl-CoA dehydrogenase
MMLSGVVGIVSGGASGLGAATVRYLIKNGGRVVVADLAHQREAYLRLAAIAAAEVGSNGEPPGNFLAFAETDVTDPDQISKALDMAEQVFSEPVNAAISCAGIGVARKTLSTKRGSTEGPKAHPLDEFYRTLHINTIGSFNMARLAAERMASREPDEKDGLRGCIINTASIAAFDGQIGQVAYAASKGALVAMTLPMARDLASYGIRVMTIVRQ